MHYLKRADGITRGALRWGILTNGRHWRLYFQGALSIAEDFLEIDLGKVFDLPGCQAELIDAEISSDHAFRLFLLLFGRDAFLRPEQGPSFHEKALADARQWEARVARDLSDVVFDEVFPKLVGALARHDPQRPAEIDPAYLELVRSGALFLLYRLLFVLYAEDRNLLPDETGPYADFSLTRMRRDVAARKAAGGVFTQTARIYWERLNTIFDAIARGNDELGIPPYNGGLFDPAEAPLLARVRLPDAVIGEVIYLLSHRVEGGRPRYINYRDLSVQQLGSIYESILDYAVEAGADGEVRPRANAEARHRSGSYYTPEDLVSLIIEKTIGPLVAERMAEFSAAVAAGARGDDLTRLDPATRLLDLRVVDPAMGSGHFLVSLVDWLSDKVVTAIEDAAAVAGDGYVSPLAGRLKEMREGILKEAGTHSWLIAEGQVEDRHIVRRMVLKRCIYGVDLNPMAVELAKVALWLHSFTVGAPLSFLNHHLRCGDSVLGAWIRPTVLWLEQRGSLYVNRHLAKIDSIAATMGRIEANADTDLIEVDQSKALFGLVEEATAPLDAFLSMIQAETLMGVFDSKPKRVRETPEALIKAGASPAVIAKAREDTLAFDRVNALLAVFEGGFGDPVEVAAGRIAVADPEMRARFDQGGEEATQASLLPAIRPDDRRRLLADILVRDARARAAAGRFLHWEIAFPGVWSNVTSVGRAGGFDAVIGNPPYVRQEEISAMKPALKKAYASFAGMADLYVYFYEQGLKLLRPGGRMGYVVTNKWLKAGYAEGLRRLFVEDAWVEFLADFGHAKRFFPDADVFPSVIVVRKPNEAPAPKDFDLVVIPRDDVPRSGLAEVVQRDGYRARRGQLTPEPWTLEPPDVAALMAKIKANGVPLVEYAGVKPLYGVKTGLNDAFLIDTQTRERLIHEDPRAVEIIKPYLRGQDVERWTPNWAGLWMIFTRRGLVIENYPSILLYLSGHKKSLEPKPDNWEGEWSGRKAGNYKWYEIQDTVEYYKMFDQKKIIMKRIAFYSKFCIDDGKYYVNDSALILNSTKSAIISCLSSPIIWYFMFKNFPHKKDEALSLDIPYVEMLPIAEIKNQVDAELDELSHQLAATSIEIRTTDRTLADWLGVEFSIEKLPTVLGEASKLNADAFVAAVRAARPRKQGISPMELKKLRDAFAEVAEPARTARDRALARERRLSDIVNQAYGLTPEDIALMWRTAPPRMPIPPPIGLV